jgi:hypothetical protein
MVFHINKTFFYLLVALVGNLVFYLRIKSKTESVTNTAFFFNSKDKRESRGMPQKSTELPSPQSFAAQKRREPCVLLGGETHLSLPIGPHEHESQAQRHKDTEDDEIDKFDL